MLNSSHSEEDIFTNMIQKEVENFLLLVPGVKYNVFALDFSYLIEMQVEQ